MTTSEADNRGFVTSLKLFEKKEYAPIDPMVESLLQSIAAGVDNLEKLAFLYDETETSQSVGSVSVLAEAKAIAQNAYQGYVRDGVAKLETLANSADTVLQEAEAIVEGSYQQHVDEGVDKLEACVSGDPVEVARAEVEQAFNLKAAA